MILIIGSRLIANYFISNKHYEKKVAIYGAGSAGIQLASALRSSKEIKPVAFIDQNKSLEGTYLSGLKVLNPNKLENLITKNKVDEVLIAMPSVSRSSLNNLLKDIQKFAIKVRILPGLAELAQGKVLVSELKEVDVSDLLGRTEVEGNLELLNKDIKNKTVLITGAGGSIGSEITRQVSLLGAKRIIVLDSSEYFLYKIRKEVEDKNLDIELNAILADVTNRNRILQVCNAFDVDTIYHTAAYKHVPLVEENPFEGVKNNIFGTKSCIDAAIEANVDTFVLISTDKAVRPTNIMGATKRFSEMILQAEASRNRNRNKTKITMVRFGNVLGSSGSAVPLFQQQIKNGGPVTVTDPEITRYFMSIPEAAQLVIQAGAMGEGGDVFVLDMGEPVKIYDLAKRLISLSGMELKDDISPDGDIEIIFTGLRPGEKLYEELLIGDSVSRTKHSQIFRAEEDYLEYEELNSYVEKLKKIQISNDIKALKEIFKEVIHGFTPEEEVHDSIYTKKIFN